VNEAATPVVVRRDLDGIGFGKVVGLWLGRFPPRPPRVS
jgi:hypothetical protein